MTPASQTTHADRIAGWIVLGLILSIIGPVVVVAFCPHLTAVAQSQMLGIAIGAVGALAGALNLKRPTQPADSSQQVTIPGDNGQAPVTIQTTTGAAIPSPPPASSLPNPGESDTPT